MAMREQQERHSPPLETARTASDEPQLPGLGGPITAGSAATMAIAGVMAGGGGAGVEEEQGPEGAPDPDNVRSSSPSVALLSVIGSSLFSVSSHIVTPKFQRKRRSHVPRAAAPAHKWDFKKLPVLPPAPAKKKARRKRTAKKRDMPCVLCEATKTPMWRTWPTDPRVMLCNACGIRVRTPGLLLPELVYLLPPATATTTTVVSESEQPVTPPQEIQPASDSPRPVLPKKVHVNLPPPATVVSELPQQPPQEIQDSESSPPDSPILESMLGVDVYLLKRALPKRKRNKSPPPPPPPPPPPAPPTVEPAAAPAPGNEEDEDEPVKCCLHCGNTWTLQWRMGPAGEKTLCNPCGVRYRQGRLVPEYRPKWSPTFDEAAHSNKHRQVLQIRRMRVDPAPPAPYKRIRTKRRRNKGKEQPNQPAQVLKKPKSNKQQNQPAQAQPAAATTVLPVRKQLKEKEHRRQPPQLAATSQPHAGNGILQNLSVPTPPPPPALPQVYDDDDMVRYLSLPSHAGDVGQQRLLFLPPILRNAGDEMEQQLPPPPPPELPHYTIDGNMDVEQEQHLPPPPAQSHAGDQMMMNQPLPPPDPFLFEGPSAPMIIEDDDEPVEVIVIDDY